MLGTLVSLQDDCTPIEIEDILLLYRRPGGLKDAMPLLVDHTSRNPDDWVALQYLAGGYQLAARKLASANLPENDATKLASFPGCSW